MKHIRIVLLLSLSLLWGCKPGRIQSGPAVRIAVGGQTQLVYLPLTLTERLGHFRDEGLEVTIEDFQGGAKALEALVGGSVDVVSGFYDHTIQMAAEGKPMQAFVSMLRYPGLVIAVSPATKRRIGGLRDLDGAVVGVSAPGSSTHLLVLHLLSKHGVSAEKAGIVGIGMAAGSVAAMERGTVDAAVMAEPAISQLETRAGKLKLLADLRMPEGVKEVYGVESYPASVLYAPEAWIEKNQLLAQRLARAVRRTLDWIGKHSGEEIARAMPESFAGGDKAMYAKVIEQSRPMYSTDGRISAEGAAVVAEVMSRLMPKIGAAKVDAGRTYRNDLVE